VQCRSRETDRDQQEVDRRDPGVAAKPFARYERLHAAMNDRSSAAAMIHPATDHGRRMDEPTVAFHVIERSAGTREKAGKKP
jgi:hypothetical protein